MRIVAIMGSMRKHGAGAGYVKQLEKALAEVPGVEFETVWLGDCDIGLCRGCRVCYDRGEGACPLGGRYLEAMAKLNGADAAIFYSPVYAMAMSGLMKSFLDRSSWVLHRPHFKGRHALVLTAVAAWPKNAALLSLRKIVSMMGFGVAGSLAVVNMRYDALPRYRQKVDRALRGMAQRLLDHAGSGKPVRPSLFELVAFQIQKAAFGDDSPDCANDKLFWKQAGWADPQAVYYCPARVAPMRAALARVLARAYGRFKLGG